MSENKSFVHETEIYRLLEEVGLNVPQYGVVAKESDPNNLPFQEGDEVVIKGLADELWHKSDAGALHFIKYNSEEVLSLHDKMKGSLEPKYPFIETLVCKKVPFKTMSNLPTEGFVSIRREEACGYVIRMGLGGIHTEAWAKELTRNILTWPVDHVSSEEAFKEAKEHWLFKVWLGTLRQGKPLSTEAALSSYLKKLWDLTKILSERDIELLEMNPVVLAECGTPMALDGVGVKKEKGRSEPPKEFDPTLFMRPKKIAIAGVSAKKGSFGGVIFKNLLKSNLTKDQLTVIKPGEDTYEGVRCYPDISALVDNPVDCLILALPAKISAQMIGDLCNQGAGADVVYIVAGGIGDGGDKAGYGDMIKSMLRDRRANGLWAPSVLGPNSLGVVLSPDKVNTLFIPEERLPVHFHENGNIGFVSQSGAFFITRLSNNISLPIKYGFCIGNQIDIKISDFVDILAHDDDLNVLGLYVEGLDGDDAGKLAHKAKKYIDQGKHIVLYKGGRSEEGMEAAAGHTGAMAGDYDLLKGLLERSNVEVAESFSTFAAKLAWHSSWPGCSKFEKVGIISNAGFETVGGADNLGVSGINDKRMLFPFDEEETKFLEKVIEDNGLTSLVGVSNPMDLTPMADEKAYLDTAEAMARGSVDAIMVGLVPLTERLDVFSESAVRGFGQNLLEISKVHKKPIGVVVDSGALYDSYRHTLQSLGLPVFNSMEQALSAIRL